MWSSANGNGIRNHASLGVTAITSPGAGGPGYG
jgi:hypothetical protein